jgi:hypothetical protein
MERRHANARTLLTRPARNEAQQDLREQRDVLVDAGEWLSFEPALGLQAR